METRRIYCLVPADLAGRLHEPLRRHFRDEPEVEVIVERRRRERRSWAERREAVPRDRDRAKRGAEPESDAEERRRIRGPGGRRVADRRAALVALPADELPRLPRAARRHAERLTFVERLAPSTEQAEDADTARLVGRIQAGERELFAELYMRYFDRVYGYLRALLRDRHEAEDATQHVFTGMLESLDGYECRGKPFRGWLFTVARNHALNRLRDSGRLEIREPEEMDRIRDESEPFAEQLNSLVWISDRDLFVLVERLPLAQRQVLLLRHQLGLTPAEAGRVLDRTPDDVRMLQHRAHRFLRERLTALGRAPEQRKHRGRQRRMLRRVPEATVLRARRFQLRR